MVSAEALPTNSVESVETVPNVPAVWRAWRDNLLTQRGLAAGCRFRDTRRLDQTSDPSQVGTGIRCQIPDARCQIHLHPLHHLHDFITDIFPTSFPGLGAVVRIDAPTGCSNKLQPRSLLSRPFCACMYPLVAAQVLRIFTPPDVLPRRCHTKAKLISNLPRRGQVQTICLYPLRGLNTLHLHP